MPRSSIIAGLLSIALWPCVGEAQMTAPCLERPPAERPYTRMRLLDIVKNQTPVRAEYLIRTCGVRVTFDGDLETDLRKAGARDNVISAIRDAAPKAALASKSEPAKGDIRIHSKDQLRYVFIPLGVFRMGCSPDDDNCKDDEKPVHEVHITKGFWMGQTPVTVEAYKRYVHATGKSMPDEPGFLDKNLNPDWNLDSVPMTMVSWIDSRRYCEWAGLRLPTEAEWEYAARAGTTGSRFGPLDEIAWWGGNAGDKPIDADSIVKSDSSNYATKIMGNGNRPRGVGQKRANEFKLYDMLGNVWQWTADWYKKTYDTAGVESDPQGAPGGEHRVIRGGSFFNESSLIRVSSRGRLVRPGTHDFGNGFRCVGEARVP